MGNFSSKTSEEDLERCLTSFDEVSQTFDVIVTQAIHHLIPDHYVAIISHHGLQEYYEDLSNLFNSTDKDFTTLYAGSKPEGIYLMFHLDPQREIIFDSSDTDIMYILHEPVGETLQKAIEENCMLYLDSSRTHPGYARVKYVKQDAFNKNVHYRLKPEIANLMKMTMIAQNMMGDEVTNNGPAVTCFTQGTMEYNHGPKRVPGVESSDTVIALPLKGIPTFMRKWKRDAINYTSLESLYSKAKEKYSYGFLLVRVAHPFSRDPHLEWRVSCSILELLLCQELTSTQRKIYLAFKYLVKEATKEQSKIKTYFLKTTLLWALETTPPETWNDNNLAQCVYLLLDKFTGFLVDRDLPHYFILGNNLIGHLSGDDIQLALNALHKVRKDPVGHIMKFQKHARLSEQCQNPEHAFETSLFRFLDEVKICLEAYKKGSVKIRAEQFFTLLNLSFLTELHVCLDLLLENLVVQTIYTIQFYIKLCMGAQTLSFGYYMNNFPSCAEDFYRFCMILFKCAYRPATSASCFFLLENMHDKFFQDVGGLHHRFKLLEVILHSISTRYLDDHEQARLRLDQCAKVFATLVNDMNVNVVTQCEYLCFFSQLWHDRFQTVGCKGFLSEANEFLKVLYRLNIFITEVAPAIGHKEFYCVQKFVCFSDKWEPNINIFIKENEGYPTEVPHEIVGLFEGILTIRTVLFPKALTLLSQVDGSSAYARELQVMLRKMNYLHNMAERQLHDTVMKYNTDSFAQKHFSNGINCANFLLSVAMMYAGNWNGAHERLAFIDQTNNKVVYLYQSICKLVILYLMSKELPHDAHSPSANSHSERNVEKGGGASPSESGLLCNPEVDMSTYGWTHFTKNVCSERFTVSENHYMEAGNGKFTRRFGDITVTVPYDNSISGFYRAMSETHCEVIKRMHLLLQQHM